MFMECGMKNTRRIIDGGSHRYLKKIPNNAVFMFDYPPSSDQPAISKVFLKYGLFSGQQLVAACEFKPDAELLANMFGDVRIASVDELREFRYHICMRVEKTNYVIAVLGTAMRACQALDALIASHEHGTPR